MKSSPGQESKKKQGRRWARVEVGSSQHWRCGERIVMPGVELSHNVSADSETAEEARECRGGGRGTESARK